MNTEIITIGDEILIGHIADTNSYWMANHLTENGFEVKRITTVPDRVASITRSLHDASGQSDFVFVTGGLGPTNDDVTRKAITEFFGLEWKLNKQVFKRLEKFLKERGYAMSHLNEEQAKVPEGSEIHMNYVGTAPGIQLKKNDTHFIFMPGVHFEMKKMMEESIVPALKEKYIKSSLINQVILTSGIPEAYLADKLKNWEESIPGHLRIAYLPSPGLVKIRLSGKSEDPGKLKAFVNKKIEELKKIIPEYYVKSGITTLEKIVGRLLTESGETVSTAESCTGGGIASRITSVSGSSEYFTGSVVAYSNKIKETILKVNPDIIETHGAVSKQVTESLAKGILNLYHTDYSIAVSGIAGPTGGTNDKPVGLTWITVASKDKVLSEKYLFGNKRDVNIEKAIVTSLNMLRKLVLEKNKNLS